MFLLGLGVGERYFPARVISAHRSPFSWRAEPLNLPTVKAKPWWGKGTNQFVVCDAPPQRWPMFSQWADSCLGLLFSFSQVTSLPLNQLGIVLSARIQERVLMRRGLCPLCRQGCPQPSAFVPASLLCAGWVIPLPVTAYPPTSAVAKVSRAAWSPALNIEKGTQDEN